jgi:hypothetical protein
MFVLTGSEQRLDCRGCNREDAIGSVFDRERVHSGECLAIGYAVSSFWGHTISDSTNVEVLPIEAFPGRIAWWVTRSLNRRRPAPASR